MAFLWVLCYNIVLVFLEVMAVSDNWFDAVVAGDAGRVGRLLEAGQDVNALNNNGFPALSVAVMYKHDQVVTRLLAVPEIVVNGLTVLQNALFLGHTNIALQLLSVEGIDINEVSHNGNTALMFATSLSSFLYGYDEIVKLLLKADADVNARNKTGDTVLIMALNRRHGGIVAQLLEAGASITPMKEFLSRPFATKLNRIKSIFTGLKALFSARDIPTLKSLCIGHFVQKRSKKRSNWYHLRGKVLSILESKGIQNNSMSGALNSYDSWLKWQQMNSDATTQSRRAICNDPGVGPWLRGHWGHIKVGSKAITASKEKELSEQASALLYDISRWHK
tara:strand:- start:1403 stop:2407 length:1005 start_codon:yes stop_codon:yes gene_type:complete